MGEPEGEVEKPDDEEPEEEEEDGEAPCAGLRNKRTCEDVAVCKWKKKKNGKKFCKEKKEKALWQKHKQSDDEPEGEVEKPDDEEPEEEEEGEEEDGESPCAGLRNKRTCEDVAVCKWKK